jgi:hypothetical protein
MSVRVAEPRGHAKGVGAGLRGAKERLVSAIREVVGGLPQEGKVEASRKIPELNAHVVAEQWGAREVHRDVTVVFTDVLVDRIISKPMERVVARVGVTANSNSWMVELYTIDDPPVTWRPPRALTLLPVAFNTALSELGVEGLLGGELGLRLRARSVLLRRMFDAIGQPRSVVLVDFDANGKPLVLNTLQLKLRHYWGVWGVNLSCSALLRHGDKKFARRLYMLAWLKKELRKALNRLRKEKGYDYEVIFDSVFRVKLGDGKASVAIPIPRITLPWDSLQKPVRFFDEEYIVISCGEIERYVSSGKNLAERLAEMCEHVLESVKRDSFWLVAELVEYANRLMGSEDPRLKDLGTLLAVLIKRAYEEAEMAIPG